MEIHIGAKEGVFPRPELPRAGKLHPDRSENRSAAERLEASDGLGRVGHARPMTRLGHHPAGPKDNLEVADWLACLPVRGPFRRVAGPHQPAHAPPLGDLLASCRDAR